jgi:hypothetical protein
LIFIVSNKFRFFLASI